MTPGSAPAAAVPTSHPAAADPSPGPGRLANADRLQVAVTDDPFAALNERLSASGSTCFVLTHATKSVDGQDLDRRIASAGGPGQFLSAGEWAAPPNATFADAARAFDATWAGARDPAASDGWIEVGVDGHPTGVELTAYTTPFGNTVWLRASTLANASCDGNT